MANSEYSHSEYGQLHTAEMADYNNIRKGDLQLQHIL
jgi:hypothetical protein